MNTTGVKLPRQRTASPAHVSGKSRKHKKSAKSALSLPTQRTARRVVSATSARSRQARSASVNLVPAVNSAKLKANLGSKQHIERDFRRAAHAATVQLRDRVVKRLSEVASDIVDDGKSFIDLVWDPNDVLDDALATS